MTSCDSNVHHPRVYRRNSFRVVISFQIFFFFFSSAAVVVSRLRTVRDAVDSSNVRRSLRLVTPTDDRHLTTFVLSVPSVGDLHIVCALRYAVFYLLFFFLLLFMTYLSVVIITLCIYVPPLEVWRDNGEPDENSTRTTTVTVLSLSFVIANDTHHRRMAESSNRAHLKKIPSCFIY